MTQLATQKPLRVSTEGTAGPFIVVLVSQLDEVKRVLDSHGISYWVSDHAISWDGGPEETVINLGRKGNAAVVQAILDNIR